MAEGKQVPLSIIIRTVDKATAGIEAINKKLDELTKPTREFGKALKELGEKSGFNKVAEGFHGVREAAGEVFIKLLEGVAIIGETTHLLLEMVEGFSTLNDTAERVGVSVDALAGLRYAASKSGASIEKLDQGVTTFVENLGALKAGKGKLVEFLGVVAPTMLTQLKATRTTEEALGIFADGMEKLTNKSKQLKMAQVALGDPALAAVFHRGSAGIMELMKAYAGLAGPQQEAAERAAKVDDALKDLHASTEGVKAALVTGLSPALTEIIDKLTAWLSGHREDIEVWATDLGKKLPGAVEHLVGWVTRAYDKVVPFIDQIGGWNVAAGALAAVIAGPLVAAVAALSIALVATPFGQVLLGLTAITLAIMKLTGATEGFESVAERLGFTPKKQKKTVLRGGIPFDAEEEAQKDEEIRRNVESAARAKAALDADPVVRANRDLLEHRRLLEQHAVPALTDAPTATEIAMEQLRQLATQQPKEVKIKVDFMNVPKGVRATADPANTANVDMSVGYLMGGGGY